jgi:hypothetical protein
VLRFSPAKHFSLSILPVDFFRLTWPIAIVKLKGRTISPVVQTFIECIRDVGLPPEKWSFLMYGLWPDGGLKNGKEATHCGRDRHEAAAG